MEDIHNKLKNILKELIPHIKGEWFLCDGGLLGIVREGHLLNWDNDLDLYFMPNCYIDLESLKESNLLFQNYYGHDKISHKDNPINKDNCWTDYVGYMRYEKFKDLKYNRSRLLTEASKSYKENKKKNNYTFPYIDIFYLEKENDKYYIKENRNGYPKNVFNHPIKLKTNHTLGFPINIPQNSQYFLKTIYGDDWYVPNKEYKNFS